MSHYYFNGGVDNNVSEFTIFTQPDQDDDQATSFPVYLWAVSSSLGSSVTLNVKYTDPTSVEITDTFSLPLTSVPARNWKMFNVYRKNGYDVKFSIVLNEVLPGAVAGIAIGRGTYVT